MTTPELYSHDSRGILPVLERFLPSSVSLVGSVLASPASATSTLASPPLKEVLMTFPPSTKPPEEWMAIAVLPGAAMQVRIFHSLEAARSPSPEDIARGLMMVTAVVAHLLDSHPEYKLGAVHELWAEPLRLSVVGGRHHTVCTVFHAPKNKAEIDVGGADLSGLVLDKGRPGDEVHFHEKSGYRALAFYAARLEYTSVLRPVSPPGVARPLPVVWVITLPDGAVGALYTMPDYRRRGLAKVVVTDRLAKCSDLGLPTYCHVEVTNQASERMWEGMGWTRGHKVQWIYRESTVHE